jgi:F-box domain
MSSKCHLLDLPDEVLLLIVIKLPLADLFSCLLSCHRLSRLTTESSLLQYLIRAMRHGLYDPLISDISIPQRIKALEIWECAWLDLDVGGPFQRYPLSAIGLEDTRRCKVQSGILIGTQFKGLRLSGGYCYLDFLHLLNKSEAVARIDIPNMGGDTHVQSWTYAPESDLMAIIFRSELPSHQCWVTASTDLCHRKEGNSPRSLRSPKLRLLQFSTGSKHPSAANDWLGFNEISTNLGACLECCGDNIVVVICNGVTMKDENRDFIFLVEWRTGRITQASSLTTQHQRPPDTG